MNLMDGILTERDRLLALRAAIGEEVWQQREMCMYRAFHHDLVTRAAQALGGHMETIDMLALYTEMRSFKG